jgi:hypothetical protein
VTKRRDELGRAAFASLQPRLFGRWDRALSAAGLDADDVSRYRRWDQNTVAFELRARAMDDEELNSGADPARRQRPARGGGPALRQLRQRAARRPGEPGYRAPATRVDAAGGHQRAQSRAEDGRHLADSAVRREDPALYGAAVRLFGTFTAAASGEDPVEGQGVVVAEIGRSPVRRADEEPDHCRDDANRPGEDGNDADDSAAGLRRQREDQSEPAQDDREDRQQKPHTRETPKLATAQIAARIAGMLKAGRERRAGE